MYQATINDYVARSVKKQTIEKAYPFDWEGLEFIAHRNLGNNSYWVVTEPKTGRLISRYKTDHTTKKIAIQEAIETLETVGKQAVIEAIGNFTK